MVTNNLSESPRTPLARRTGRLSPIWLSSTRSLMSIDYTPPDRGAICGSSPIEPSIAKGGGVREEGPAKTPSAWNGPSNLLQPPPPMSKEQWEGLPVFQRSPKPPPPPHSLIWLTFQQSKLQPRIHAANER